MRYTPARSPEPIELGRTDCPLVVLRSHPDFPNTLASDVEGVWVGTNPAWPDATVDWLLDRLQPPCHTDWSEFKAEVVEKRGERKASVVYVKPGPRTAPSIAGNASPEAPPCNMCGTIMNWSRSAWKCPNCGHVTGPVLVST